MDGWSNYSPSRNSIRLTTCLMPRSRAWRLWCSWILPMPASGSDPHTDYCNFQPPLQPNAILDHPGLFSIARNGAATVYRPLFPSDISVLHLLPHPGDDLVEDFRKRRRGAEPK